MSLRKLISALTLLSVASLGGQALAGHSPLDGQLRVDNQRSEGGRLFVDGDFKGFVPAGSSRRIENVPNGVRLVEFKVRNLPVTTRRVSVEIQRTAGLTLKAILGSARIVNDSGIAMKIKLDGVKLGRLNPNSVREIPGLKPGKHRLVVRPARRLTSSNGHITTVAASSSKGGRMVKTFDIRGGRETSVAIGEYLSKISVRNPFTRPAILKIDGQRIGKLAAFETRMIDGIVPGKRALELTGRRRSLISERIAIQAGTITSWRPTPARSGSLTLRNQWGVAVKIKLDKAVIGVLQPGETRTFRHVSAGKHLVTSSHPWAGSITRTVHVPAGRHMNVAVGRAIAPPKQARFRKTNAGTGVPAGWTL
jgi:hypothetical protein